MNTEEQIRRAEQARRIMDDPLVVEAFQWMHDDFMREWEGSQIRDVEARETIFHMVKATKKFRIFFEALIADGKVAAHKIAEAAQTRI